MKTLILILFFATAIPSQWLLQNSGSSSELIDMDFMNTSTGWIAGSAGVILKTSNGGTVWQLYQYDPNYRLNSVCFLNDATGFISGTYYESYQFQFNVVLKTSNSGMNWSPVRSDVGYQNRMTNTSVSFFDVNNGLLTKSGSDGFTTLGSVLRTINGGINWSLVSFPSYIAFAKVVCTAPSSAFLLGGYNTDVPGHDTLYVFKTTNMGNGWTEVYRSRGLALRNMSVSNGVVSLTGDFSATTGILVRSTNLGADWDTVSSGTIPQVRNAYFLNLNTGWLVGYNGNILYTENGGVNWAFQQQSQQYPLNDIYVFPSCTGWAIGNSGKILKTVNCGLTGITQLGSIVPDNFSLSQNYPNPFNPMTKLKFDVMSNVKGQMSNVNITIFDALGREVHVLVNQELSPGTYVVDFDGSDLPSGVYYYRLEVNTPRSGKSEHPSGERNFVQTRKMVLIK